MEQDHEPPEAFNSYLNEVVQEYLRRCPTPQQLRELARATLKEPYLTITQQHLKQCRKCQEQYAVVQRGLNIVREMTTEPIAPPSFRLVPAFGFLTLVGLIVYLFLVLQGSNSRLISARQEAAEQKRQLTEQLQAENRQLQDKLVQAKQELDATRRRIRKNQAPPQIALQLPADRAQYAVATDTVRSNAPSETLLPLQLFPVGTAIETLHPRFQWIAYPQAEQYTLFVKDLTTGKTAFNGQVGAGTTYTLRQPLLRGHLYTWQVTSTLKASPTEIIYHPAKFRVLTQTEAKTLQIKQQRWIASQGDVVMTQRNLGILYANTGLLADARRVFEVLLTINPDDRVTQQLLQRLNEAQSGKVTR